jgi:dihydroflavonol-4-reductase
MKCFVTGASGFIGANLVHELLARGHHVKALVRPGSNLHSLDGLDFERVEGELGNRDICVAGMRGCDWCFHAAASYHLWLKNYAPMYSTNVDGTRNVIEAAIKVGCARVVYTSTVGCVGLPQVVHGKLNRPADESTPLKQNQLTNHYKISKWKAEQSASKLVAIGAPVVIVNPSAPIGPRDVKPTPTGQIIVDYLNRKMPAYLDTGLNWVHVRDVAVGHILAAEKGRVGERYILGNAEGNWTMKQTFAVLQELTGIPAPKVKVPYGVALLAACFNELGSKITDRPPRVPLAGVRMAADMMFYNPAKAIRELGLPQTPPKQALTDAVEWFRAHGYAKK